MYHSAVELEVARTGLNEKRRKELFNMKGFVVFVYLVTTINVVFSQRPFTSRSDYLELFTDSSDLASVTDVRVTFKTNGKIDEVIPLVTKVYNKNRISVVRKFSFYEEKTFSVFWSKNEVDSIFEFVEDRLYFNKIYYSKDSAGRISRTDLILQDTILFTNEITYSGDTIIETYSRQNKFNYQISELRYFNHSIHFYSDRFVKYRDSAEYLSSRIKTLEGYEITEFYGVEGAVQVTLLEFDNQDWHLRLILDENGVEYHYFKLLDHFSQSFRLPSFMKPEDIIVLRIPTEEYRKYLLELNRFNRNRNYWIKKF
jgi:hypothetical protein